MLEQIFSAPCIILSSLYGTLHKTDLQVSMRWQFEALGTQIEAFWRHNYMLPVGFGGGRSWWLWRRCVRWSKCCTNPSLRGHPPIPFVEPSQLPPPLLLSSAALFPITHFALLHFWIDMNLCYMIDVHRFAWIWGFWYEECGCLAGLLRGFPVLSEVTPLNGRSTRHCVICRSKKTWV